MGDIEEIYKHGTFVIWPSGKIRKIVSGLRKMYDPKSQKICGPHIFLTQPFKIKPGEATWKKIDKIAKGFSKFKITVGPVEQFGSSYVIKFNIQPRKRIVELRNRLHKLGFFNTDLPYTKGFIPHMTVSEGALRGDKKVKKVISGLNKKLKKMRFECSEITYIVPNKKFHFNVKRRIKLKR